MKEIFKKIKLFLNAGKRIPHKIKKKTRAQSMVEFAVTLPILIALLLGMVEFGFMLNTYLSLLDATRYAARQFSNSNPLKLVGTTKVYDENFDNNVAKAVIDNLDPYLIDPEARRIILDPTMDDILIHVLSVNVNTNTNPDTISTVTALTTDLGNPVPFISSYGNFAALGGTHYTETVVRNSMSANGAQPVSAGILIVELYYSYEGTLSISTEFMELFATNKHVMLYSSTIMPLVSVRPALPTPTP
jgi:hypothetical protein